MEELSERSFFQSRSNSMISTATSMINKDTSLIVAAPVTIRGRRLRQILHVLPIDVMEVQMLAREFFARCDLQEKYMSLAKFAETFGISHKIARGVYSYIRTNDVLDDVPFNYARKLALLYPQNGNRRSVIEELQEWSRIYGETQQQGLHLHTPRKSVLQLPKLYLTFENFVEAAVYLSPRASEQQRIDLAFSIFDANGDGFVDAEEIKNVMLGSLQAVQQQNNHNQDSTAKNVENLFRSEVEELINDLKAQYGSDEFTKEEFIEFARGVEFLNCFTVNKHWLRDILGDNKDNTRYARPQDAEMKHFLESICEENESIDSEHIIDLQEKLRDHLVDTVDDLKTMKPKHFNQMNINRRVSGAIFSKIKSLKTDQDEEYQDLISGGLLDQFAVNNAPSGNSSNNLLDMGGMDMILQDTNCCVKCMNYLRIIYVDYISKKLPTIHKVMQSCFIIFYIIVMILCYIYVNIDNDETDILLKMGKVSSYGLYLCLFIAPLSRYYPFITKWISLTPNNRLSHFVLYFTSRESEKINICFAVFFAFIHVCCYQIHNLLDTTEDGMSFIKYNMYSTFPISGLVMIVFGIALIFMWYQIRYKDNNHGVLAQLNHKKFDPFTKTNTILWMLFRAAFVVLFIFHAMIAPSDDNKSINTSYGQHISLYITLFPIILILILTNFEYILGSTVMSVELAKNERPNYVLLSMKMKNPTKNKKNIQWRCGQYVEINCPSISKFEYHPFYITSSPDSNYLNLSILSCGDWTRKLWQTYVADQQHHQEIDNLSDLKICGPYGIGFTSNKMNYNFDYLLVVATGNGSVEIIASLLNFVCSNFLTNPKHPIQKIYCYWMVSADDGCYWFYKLLRDLRNMYIDKFFPCIFVTSSNHDDRTGNSFGLNFFLALRRESLQTNLVTQQIRLSAGRISTLRRPVSIFTPNSRPSRFHNQTNNLLGSLKINKAAEMNKNKINENNNQHGIEINNLDLNNGPFNEEDISMQSPDFRHAFNKIREELIQNQMNKNNYSSPATPLKSNLNLNQQPIKQGTMHGVVPALVVATNNSAISRTYQVGTFFVGSEILEHRLKHLCQQFTDNQVIFEFNSIVIGDNYTNRYSTS